MMAGASVHITEPRPQLTDQGRTPGVLAAERHNGGVPKFAPPSEAAFPLCFEYASATEESLNIQLQICRHSRFRAQEFLQVLA